MGWLQKKYISLIGGELSGFTKKGEHLWNMRCPYCGDSKKDRSKKRGFIYRARGIYFYKCHNCDIAKPFESFLYDQGQTSGLARRYFLEKIQLKAKTESVTLEELLASDDPKPADPPPEEPVENVLELVKKLFTPILDLPEDAPARRYLEDRGLHHDAIKHLYWCDDLAKVSGFSVRALDKIIPGEGRIAIIAADGSGKLLAVTFRSIDPNSRTKYLEVRISKGDEPTIYGLDRVDPDKTIFVCEGPIDGLCVDNGIGVGGSSFKEALKILADRDTVIVTDNQPRNPTIVREIERRAEEGHTMFIWPMEWDWKVVKDVNDLVKVTGWSPTETAAFFKQHAKSGLALKVEIAKWKGRG